MQLRFKGQTYTAGNSQIQTVATEHTACFRGQKYQIRTPVVPVSHDRQYQLSARIGKYRGVCYIVERQLPNTPEQPEACYR